MTKQEEQIEQLKATVKRCDKMLMSQLERASKLSSSLGEVKQELAELKGKWYVKLFRRGRG